MDAQKAAEAARRWEQEAQRLEGQATRAGDLADVLGFMAAGWGAEQYAGRMAFSDRGTTRREDFAFALALCTDIWAAIEGNDEEGAADLALQLREHFRRRLGEYYATVGGMG